MLCGTRFPNAEGMPYPTAPFDAVAIMDLLEHVPDVSAVLAEVRRVCKPGAIGFCVTARRI